MRALACFAASLLVGFLGCARHTYFSADPHALAEQDVIYAEAEGDGADYESAELLASMNAVSKISGQTGTSADAVIARPDFRVYVLQTVQREPFYRVKVCAVILAP